MSSDKAFIPPTGELDGGATGLLRRDAKRRLLVAALIGLYFVLLATPAVLLVRQHTIRPCAVDFPERARHGNAEIVADVGKHASERRRDAGPVRGLLGGRDLTGRFRIHHVL